MIEELSNLTNDGFDDVHNEIQKIHDEKVLQYLAQIKEGLEANQKADKQNETLTQNRIYIDQQQKSINDNTQSILLYKDLIAKNTRSIKQNQQKILDLQKKNEKLEFLVRISLILSIISIIANFVIK